MFVVLRDIQSSLDTQVDGLQKPKAFVSAGVFKKVKEESIELDKDLTAEGKSPLYLFLNSLKNPIALSLDEA